MDIRSSAYYTGSWPEQQRFLDLRSSTYTCSLHLHKQKEQLQILRKSKGKLLTTATDGERSQAKDTSPSRRSRRTSSDGKVLPSSSSKNGAVWNVRASSRTLENNSSKGAKGNTNSKFTESGKLPGNNSLDENSDNQFVKNTSRSSLEQGLLQSINTRKNEGDSVLKSHDKAVDYSQELAMEMNETGGMDLNAGRFKKTTNTRSSPMTDLHEDQNIVSPSGIPATSSMKDNDNGVGQNGRMPVTKSIDFTSEKSSGSFSDEQLDQNGSAYVFKDDRKSALAYLLASKNILEFISRFPSWADAQKESGMPQRQKRAFYSHDDWLRHRSSMRYVRHMLSSLSSRVIVSLFPPVFTFTMGAFVVASYNTAVNTGLFPSFFPLIHASSLPYELTAPALALLLVFRTDASYSRYVEARKTWTTVIGVTKDFARQSAQLIQSPEDEVFKDSLLAYIMSFPIALKCHLIHGSDMRRELQNLLQDEDLAFVLASQHRPNCILQLMSRTLSLVQLPITERALLEAHISQYNASVSVCERLLRTPIPLSYTRLTSRFLVLWHTSLPIVLWDTCNWLVVPATFFSAATLFCIEEVGVVIEEPFPMLALDKIIGIALENVREMIYLQQKADDFLSLKRKLSIGGSDCCAREVDPD